MLSKKEIAEGIFCWRVTLHGTGVLIKRKKLNKKNLKVGMLIWVVYFSGDIKLCDYSCLAYPAKIVTMDTDGFYHFPYSYLLKPATIHFNNYDNRLDFGIFECTYNELKAFFAEEQKANARNMQKIEIEIEQKKRLLEEVRNYFENYENRVLEFLEKQGV